MDCSHSRRASKLLIVFAMDTCVRDEVILGEALCASRSQWLGCDHDRDEYCSEEILNGFATTVVSNLNLIFQTKPYFPNFLSLCSTVLQSLVPVANLGVSLLRSQNPISLLNSRWMYNRTYPMKKKKDGTREWVEPRAARTYEAYQQRFEE
uniref:Uncharacterized protein n=1 Tax=Nicotiana tabacum TaxID=4097 RepID=A0A1S4AY73_TOBAC|nr:PREDICTED: uncharacterized protein LOC107802608 [Nicotiana tabacum]